MIVNIKTLLVFISALCLAESVSFQCNFVTLVLFNQPAYTCTAIVEPTDDESILSDVQGNHGVGLSNVDVLALEVSSETLRVLPRNLATFFPNLEAISVFNSTLSTITAEDLQLLPDLKFLRASMNNIVSLDGNLFQYNPRLTIIDFNSNWIEIIGQNLLTQLSELVIVDFSNNRCIDIYADTPKTIQVLNVQMPIRCSNNPNIVFICIFTDSMYGWVSENIYTCNAEVFGSNNELTDVIGDHLEGRSNINVRGLEIKNQLYEQVSRNIASFFPDLFVLIIFDCNLLTISAADLEPFPNLQFFRVWRNRLTTINRNLFMHNSQLRYIDFDTNLIVEVGLNLLGDLTFLEAVDFSRNNCINKFAGTPEAIQELNDILPIRCSENPGLVFKCIFTEKYWAWVDGSVYECDATVSTQFGDETFLNNVFGDHLNGKSNLDVRGLIIQNQNYDQVSNNIETFFPNLEVLSIQDCTLMAISAVDLQPFPRLVFFRVLGNQLSALDGDLFMHNPLLRHINFHNNLIREVGENLLSDLTLLGSADFGQNQCIDMYADSQQAIRELNDVLRIQCPELHGTIFACKFSMFHWISPDDYVCFVNIFQFRQEFTLLDVTGDHMENKTHSDVTVLEIQDKDFDQITRNIAAFFPNIGVISIHGCTLMTISTADLQQFPNLQYFRVWRNFLTSIDGDLFMHNPLLTYIDFDNNLIEAVGFNLLKDLTLLETIDFRRNTCIDMFANSPEEIQELNDILPIRCPVKPGIIFVCSFTDSMFAWVSDEIYTCNADVFGRDNELTGVIGDHLEGRSNIDVRGLEIQNQNFEQVTRNIASFFPDLLVLSILNSNLLTISAADLEPFPNLQFLRVWGNILRSIDSDLFMHNPLLKYIDFGTNSIVAVGLNLFEGLTSLEAVDFSRNPCIDIFAGTPEEIQELNDIFPISCSDNPGDVFNCIFANADWNLLIELVYNCEATVSQFGEEPVLRNVFGDHMEGRSNSDVSGLHIQNQIYNQLSRNIELFFPNLQVIVIQNCTLMTISAAHLPFPSLVIFRAWMNMLESLEGNLFMYNPRLIYIDLDANLIERVGLNLLDELTNLQIVDFSNNNCISIVADSPQEIRELIEMLPTKCPWLNDSNRPRWLLSTDDRNLNSNELLIKNKYNHQ